MSGMIVRHRIEVKNKEKRAELANILFTEGYTVREVGVKPAGKSVKKWYVEYWKEENQI